MGWTAFFRVVVPGAGKACRQTLSYWAAYFAWLLLVGVVHGLLPPNPGAEYASVSAACLGTVALTRRWLRREHRLLTDVVLRAEAATGPRFFLGLLVGFMMVGLLVAVSAWLHGGLIVPVANPDRARALLSGGVLLLGALHQEIAFRAYPIWALTPRLGVWRSQALIAAAFGAYHLVAGYGPVAALVGTGTWSVLYGLSALLTGGIAFPTGLHTALNVGQAVLGGPVALWQLWPPHPAAAGWQARVQNTAELARYAMVLLCIGVLAGMIRRKRARTATAGATS